MKVVRVLPDRSLEILGACNDFDPPPRPGEFVTVTEPVSAAYAPDDAPLMLRACRFPVVVLHHRDGTRETAIEARGWRPPLEWLPGWRPA
jgi:hypothetical protein